MRPRTIALSIAMIGALALTAPGARAACQDGNNTGQVLGTVGGAVLGGLLGSKIGGKSTVGKVAGVGGGAILGGLAGGALGNYLTCKDEQQVNSANQRALETQPTGTPVAWNNPDSGNSGTVTPTKTYQTQEGQYCREFQQTITVNGKSEQGYGTACRQPDGSWKVVQ